PSLVRDRTPSTWMRWLLWWLLFRLMFLSGVTKLLSGDTAWRHLTALDYHFWTQPLPTWPAWYAHWTPVWVHRAMTLAILAIALLSLLAFAREIVQTLPTSRGELDNPLLRAVEPLRSVNGYGLFRVMTTERFEILVEGSRDGVQWTEYGFRWKPGDVHRRPAFVAPHMPRLDWQLWFAALNPEGARDWLPSLLRHVLTGTPEVLALL